MKSIFFVWTLPQELWHLVKLNHCAKYEIIASGGGEGGGGEGGGGGGEVYKTNKLDNSANWITLYYCRTISHEAIFC